MDVARWEQRLRSKRKGKDHFFKTHPQSPLPWPDQKVFKGLSYFPLDPAFRFELDLEEHLNKETIQVGATRGQTRDLVRWGQFRFSVGSRKQILQVYRSDPSEDRLFVPFRDATGKEETCEKGRYLDLEPELHLLENGKWVLDFNEAYNPWCEYSQEYVCPFVPAENQLDVSIKAGEKRFSSGEGGEGT